ncbi:MAG: YgjP-like metallopeptidase domain-containing protein, partial [Thermotogota bacterium]|nr:YgjP-like metallopeptidase domain-containing protein [Thermotogota bacterium]
MWRNIFKVKSNTIDIAGIGQILFERSKRAKHINISVKPFNGVRVAVPYGVSFNKAKQVAQSKKSWIKKHLNKMKQVEKEHKEFTKNSIE